MTLTSDKSGSLDAAYCVEGGRLSIELNLAPEDKAGDSSYAFRGQVQLTQQ